MRDPRAHWNERHTTRPEVTEPAPFVVESAELLPYSGTALDVAGGTGRHALWLAEAGLRVTLIDVSDIALDIARAEASLRDLSIETIERDIEAAGLPNDSWDVVVIHLFLDRSVLATLPDRLEPGGVAIVAHPTVRNLERHPRPERHYLLEGGELAAIASDWQGMEIVMLEEGWTLGDRHVARLRARRR